MTINEFENFENFENDLRAYRDESGSVITISLIDLPKQRHKRTVAKSNLDLIST